MFDAGFIWRSALRLSTVIIILGLVTPGSLMGTARAASKSLATHPDIVVATDAALCRRPGAVVHERSAPVIETQLDQFLGHYCHRNTASGWARDKYVRDTGPLAANLIDDDWVGKDSRYPSAGIDLALAGDGGLYENQSPGRRVGSAKEALPATP